MRGPAAAASVRRSPRRGTPRPKRALPPSSLPPPCSPSALGLVSGIVFLTVVISIQLWRAREHVDCPVATLECLQRSWQRNNWYSAGLLSICFMTLLGFADDVLDLPWRYKLLLPTVASLPLLLSYTGVTDVTIPKQLGWLLVDASAWRAATLPQPLPQLPVTQLGALLQPLLRALGVTLNGPTAMGLNIGLGTWYYVYMGLFAVFATNAINIYAGINGLEAGQSAIISLAILTANLSHLREHAGDPSHLFSALLALPYLAVNLGLLVFNLHPARVFVGDTFCYFAGMTFAVNGILGHMAWTLPFFFLPQIVNFAYSLPQLFKVYPCPRHRLPDFDAALGLLRPSSFELPAAAGAAAAPAAAAPTAAAPTATRSPRSASAARRRQGKGGGEGDPAAPPAPPAPAPRRMYNMTLINLLLRATGPLHERTVTNVLLALQAVCCAAGLYARVLMRVDA